MTIRPLISVRDLDRSDVEANHYDVAIFASGFEARASSLANSIPLKSQKFVVLGFDDKSTHATRIENDNKFSDLFGVAPSLFSKNDPLALWSVIPELPERKSRPRKLFVDVSSMSRDMYAGVVNWARYCGGGGSVEVDFGYTDASYPNGFPTRRVRRVAALFGFEGQSNPKLQTVVILGLGFDPVTPMVVSEDLQPDLLYGLLAVGQDETSTAKALDLNRETIGELDGPLVSCSKLSVADAYRTTLEMVAPHAGDANVVLISLGPKTHVLANILAAAREPRVTCLHVSGEIDAEAAAIPSDRFSFSRARFGKLDDF